MVPNHTITKRVISVSCFHDFSAKAKATFENIVLLGYIFIIFIIYNITISLHEYQSLSVNPAVSVFFHIFINGLVSQGLHFVDSPHRQE
jgi:hypothetical protein